MVIQASFCHRRTSLHHNGHLGCRVNGLLCGPLGLILCGVQHMAFHELTVLQRLLALHILVVVDFDHRVLVLRAYRIVIQELGAGECLSFQLVRNLRELFCQQFLVYQLRMEEEPAFLNVGNARLPIHIQQVHTFHCNVTQAVELALIPHHLVAAGTRLELLPHGITVSCLKVVLFQDAGNNVRKAFGLLLVSSLTGQNVGLRIALHGIGVLADDYVVQPAGFTGKAAVSANIGFLLFLHGIAQLPPVLRCHNAVLGSGLAGLVILQDLHKLLQLLRANGLGHCCLGLHRLLHRFVFHFHVCSSLLIAITALFICKLIKRIGDNRLLFHRDNRGDGP